MTDGAPPRRGGSNRQSLCELPETARPAAFASHRLAQLLPAFPVPFDAAMLQLDARTIPGVGDEPHFDLARFCAVGLYLPTRADVPADHHAIGWFVCEHPRPLTLAAVNPTVVNAAAHAWLEHALRDFHPQQVVLGWKPAADA